jgi:hypothetical protein
VRSLLAAAVTLTLVACGGGGDTKRLGAASPPGSATATATATAPINVDDMMGLYAQQTVFVADSEKVSVISLLNHFTRYTIPTNGKAQVAADGMYGTYNAPPSSAANWLYVLDGIERGPLRLRTFDGGGVERASRSDIGSVSLPHRALALTIEGRVLVLKSDARRAWIDAYEPITLKPLGTVMEKSGCGDRLLTSGNRVAIVCRETGQIAVDGLRGNGTEVVDGALPGLAGAAMSDDGSLYVVTADRKFAVTSPGGAKLSPLPWPNEWTGTVLPDTLAVAWGSSYATIVVAQLADDGAWLRVFASNNLSQRHSLRLAGRTAGVPQFGLLGLSPFVYFTSGGSVKHVQLDNGMLETMTEVGQGATVVAVVNR